MITKLCFFSEVLFIFSLFIGKNLLVTSLEMDVDSQKYCTDLHPQKSLDLDQLMGMWYGIEVIQHRSDKGYAGVHPVSACPVLHLSRFKPSELQLYWNEKAGTVEYQFHIQNPANPGFWMSFGPQNGTLAHDFTSSMVRNTYRQFAGTVQVMKAVASHMVLTFCSPNTELYSIILSRTTYLDKIEVRGIRNMLQRRGLNQFAIRETNCNSAIKNIKSSHILMTFVILFLTVINKYVLDH